MTQPNLKTVSWRIVGAMKWGRDYATKAHIYDANEEEWPGHGQTLCGREFKTVSESDKLRRQAHGGPSYEGAYVVDIDEKLEDVDCKNCLRIKSGEPA